MLQRWCQPITAVSYLDSIWHTDSVSHLLDIPVMLKNPPTEALKCEAVTSWHKPAREWNSEAFYCKEVTATAHMLGEGLNYYNALSTTRLYFVLRCSGDHSSWHEKDHVETNTQSRLLAQPCPAMHCSWKCTSVSVLVTAGFDWAKPPGKA